MLCRRTIGVVLALLQLLVWSGCTEEPPSSLAPTSIRGDVAGVGFDVPAGWSARADESPDAVTLVCQDTHGSLGPLVRIEIVTDPKGRTVQQTIDDLAHSASSIDRYELIRNELVKHERGFEYGHLQYTQSESGIPKVEAFVVIHLAANKRLIVSAVALKKRAWPKHEPVFAKVVASLELPPELSPQSPPE